MNLKELIEAVKEKNLTKTQLGEYRDDMTNLFASVALEMAESEKTEALYFLEVKALYRDNNQPQPTDIAIKRQWRGEPRGQRQIELKYSLKALEKMLSSLKSRIYSMY